MFVVVIMSKLSPHPDFDADVSALWKQLVEFGQEHVLQFWGELPADKRTELVHDVASVDLAAMKTSYDRTQEKAGASNGGSMEPIPDDAVASNTSLVPTAATLEHWRIGMKNVGESKVAALLMAGGQVYS